MLILNGLIISPHVEYRFKTKYYNPINGSDLVHASFDANAAKIIKLFKLLFAVQDTMVNVPSRKRAPNHRVNHLFYHLIKVSTKSFEPGRNISSDEQDESF